MSVDGVIAAEVSYDDERVDVRYRLGLVELEVLVKAIEEAGFQASVASVMDEVSGPVVQIAPPVVGPKGARENKRVRSGHWLAHLRRDLVGTSPHEERVVLREQSGEIDVGIHDDPVDFVVGARDVPVQARGHLIADLRHSTP